MHRKLRLLATVTLLVGLFAAWAGTRHAEAAPAAPTTQAAGQTFTVTVGHQVFTETGDKSSWQAGRFYPESLTINVGDSIIFKHDAAVEPHTASFLGADNKFPDFLLAPSGPPPSGPPKLEVNPLLLFPVGGNSYDGSTLVSSGAMASDIPGPKEFTVTFTKAGSYTYACLIHSGQAPDGTLGGMIGKLTVQDAGKPYPMTPEQVTAAGKAMMDADEATAKAAEPEAKKVTTSTGPNGETIYHVNASYSVHLGTLGALLDYMRFSPKDLTIKQGDVVEWASGTPNGFHNVLFGDEPELFTFEPQQAGPPKAYISNEVFLPMGAATHTGTGIYSAGILQGPADPPFPGAVTKYSLTFTQAGRYEYICGLHYHNGMDGTITVKTSAGSIPGMPTTGSRSDWLLLSLVAGLILALAGMALRGRKVGELA